METGSKKGGIPVWCIVLIIFLLFVSMVLFCVVAFFIGKEFASKNNTAKQNIPIVATQNTQGNHPSQTQSYTSQTFQPQSQAISQSPNQGVQNTQNTQNNNNADRAKVVNYFEQMDLIGEQSKQFEDPNAFATEMAQGIVSGDFSTLDSLISSIDDIIVKAQQLSTPPDCVEHKKASIEILENTKDLLVSLRQSVANNDMSALSSIQARGENAKLKAEQVNQMEKDIKAKYGIN